MQNFPVIIAVIVSAAAIIAVLFWRINPQTAPNTEALDKRILEETKRAEALQAKLDAKEAALRTAESNSAAAKATMDAAKIEAIDAKLGSANAESKFNALQVELNQAKPLIARATAEKEASEAETTRVIKHYDDLVLEKNSLHNRLDEALQRAATAETESLNVREVNGGISRTLETYTIALTEERQKLAAALAKQQSSEDAARHFENIGKNILTETLEQAKHKIGELAATIQKASGDELNKHAEKVALTLEPLQAKLNAYDEAIKEFRNGSLESHVSLKEQLSRLHETERNLGDQARALTTALSSTPKYKGTYGELALERLMEHAGLQEGPHYEKQARRNTEEGLKIPDMVVKMPGNQKVIVDAKAVMAAYVAAQETPDDTERKVLLKKHCDNVRARVVELSAKNYFADHSDAVELVVLFLPAEPLYVAAVENDHGLADFALSRNVIICGPSLLIMLLKSANQLWRRASIEEESQKIKNCGDAIYDAACSFIQRYAELGTKIEQLEKAYNEAAGTLNGNLIPKGRSMGKFASMASNKEVKEIDQLKDGVRSFSSPEAKKLLASTNKLPGLMIGDETAELNLSLGDE